MDIVSPLIANRQPTVLRKPCQRALHNPPMPAQFLRTLHTLSGYAPLEAPFSQSLRALLIVVGFVGMHLIRTLPRSASRTLDRLDRVQKLLENHRIVDIGGSADHTERDARPLDHNMGFVPAFPLSVGFAPVLCPPFLRGHWPSRGRRVPNLFARLLRDDPKELDAASPILQPHATHVSVANR
jgi:hypothetical protein